MSRSLPVRIWTSFKLMGVSQRVYLFLVFISVLAIVFEGAGIGMLLPIFSLVEAGSELADQNVSGPLSIIIDVMRLLHVPLEFSSLVMIAAGSMLLRQVFFFIRQYILARVTQDCGKVLRRLVNKLVLKADIRFFIDTSHGKFLHAIMVEPISAATLVATTANIMLNLGQLIIYAGIMLFLSWELALAAGPIVAIAWVFLRGFLQSANIWALRAKEALAATNEMISEYIHGIRLVKLRSFEDQAAYHAGLQIDQSGDLTRRYDEIRALSNSIAPMIITVGCFGLLIFAVEYMHKSLAELSIFMVVAIRAQSMIVQINADRLIMARQLVSLDHVLEFMKKAEQGETIYSGDQPLDLQEKIVFQNVCFSYHSKETSQVLKDVNFEIPKGQTVAMVGPSGAGKSTLVDILLRNYDQTQGCIYFDSISHQDIKLEDLRHRIAMVPQDTFLFRDTVRNNLIFGLACAPNDDEIKEALRKAHALDFVNNLPNGLDTELGEGGADLSGGQRQRLALARALVQDPQVLVLDEPTSALDNKTEAIFQETLNELKGKLTILMIAHRLSTIKGADSIVVLNEGQVVSMGKHEELLSSCELYLRLFNK